MTWKAFFIECLSILATFPVVMGLVGVVFLRTFRHQIAEFLTSVKRAKISQTGIELDAQAMQMEDESKQLAEKTTEIPNDLNLDTTVEVEALKSRIDDLINKGLFWEFVYLNLSLIPIAQAVLNWLVELKSPVAFQKFESDWQMTINNPETRKAILETFKSHQLVQFDDNHIVVTTKGQKYANWPDRVPPYGRKRLIGEYLVDPYGLKNIGA